MSRGLPLGKISKTLNRVAQQLRHHSTHLTALGRIFLPLFTGVRGIGILGISPFGHSRKFASVWRVCSVLLALFVSLHTLQCAGGLRSEGSRVFSSPVVSSNCAWARCFAPERFAPERFAPERSASQRIAPERSAPERSAFERIAPQTRSVILSERFAPERTASLRIAPERSASERSAPVRSAPGRFAPVSFVSCKSSGSGSPWPKERVR